VPGLDGLRAGVAALLIEWGKSGARPDATFGNLRSRRRRSRRHIRARVFATQPVAGQSPFQAPAAPSQEIDDDRSGVRPNMPCQDFFRGIVNSVLRPWCFVTRASDNSPVRLAARHRSAVSSVIFKKTFWGCQRRRGRDRVRLTRLRRTSG
jgi:hypothetical protein